MTAGMKNYTTFGAALVALEAGKREVWISAAGKLGDVPTLILEGDIEIINKLREGNNANRLNDAEQTLIREAVDRKARILALGATRDMCGGCQAAATEQGVLETVATPLKKAEPFATRLPLSRLEARDILRASIADGTGPGAVIESGIYIVYEKQFSTAQRAQLARATDDLELAMPDIRQHVHDGEIAKAYAIMSAPETANIGKALFPEARDLETYIRLYVEYSRTGASELPSISTGPKGDSYRPDYEPTVAEGRRLTQYLIAEYRPISTL